MPSDTGLPTRTTDQPEELQQLLRQIREKKEQAEKVQKVYRDRWDFFYGLYHNYRKLKKAYSEADRDTRGGILLDAKREFGTELFIPYCFTVVETIVPRVLSGDPVMKVPPVVPEGFDAARRVEKLFEVQQRKTNYDLKLQRVARSGFKFGLGVQKTFWEKKTRKMLRNVPSISGAGYATVENEVVVHEGPQVEVVDIWDFLWSPAAIDIESCDWIIHRTWRSDEYVLNKMRPNPETGGSEWFPIDPEAVRGLGNEQDRGEVLANRFEAAGVENFSKDQGKLHEVWEFHNRERVITVLDDAFIVQNDVNPAFHRDLPFQIFRPTPKEHEFVGVGEIEPIVHLQAELNQMRSQRLDNAAFLIHKAFLYAEGWVDPDDFRIGPAMGIPVKGTSLRDVIQPLEFGDLPASGYQEEQEIKSDIERTTGVSDPVAGGVGEGGAAETATGVELVQNAANVRIRLKTKNLERETIRAAGVQWMELDRQHMLVSIPVRVPDPNSPNGFTFTEVAPEDLDPGLVDYPEPDSGSTEPDNPPERRNAALTLYQTLQANQQIDQQRLGLRLLREFDVPDAESYFMQDGSAKVNIDILSQRLAELGLDPETMTGILDEALAAANPEMAEAAAAEEQGAAGAA